MAKRAISAWLLTVALALTACSTKLRVPEFAAPPAPPMQSAEHPGWRYVTTTGAEFRLVSASPEGRSFFITSAVMGDREHDLLVTVGDQIGIGKPPFRHLTFDTPAHWQADLVELPWTKLALEAGSDRGNEGGGILSPDTRYAAVPLGEGLWLGDVQSGQGRIITLPPPEERPAEMQPRNHLIWATQPRWSSDSRWIYFQSNRQKPYDLTWWRIAVTGGPEEPAVGEVLADLTGRPMGGGGQDRDARLPAIQPGAPGGGHYLYRRTQSLRRDGLRLLVARQQQDYFPHTCGQRKSPCLGGPGFGCRWDDQVLCVSRATGGQPCRTWICGQ